MTVKRLPQGLKRVWYNIHHEGRRITASVAISTLAARSTPHESKDRLCCGSAAIRPGGLQGESRRLHHIYLCADQPAAASKSRQKIIRPAGRTGRPGMRCGLLSGSGGSDGRAGKIDILVAPAAKDKLPQLIDEACVSAANRCRAARRADVRRV